MNNIIKKVSAFTMAFTLLGTGTAITSSVVPQLNCAITANAAESVTNKFRDVNSGDFFADAVQFVYDREIMKGTSANTFSPYAEITREQFIMAIFNMADDPEKNKTIYQNFYTDVPDGQWYTTAVMWAHCWGITNGYGSKFGVGDKITREQLVTMLYNYETKFKKRSCNAPSNALDKFSDRNKVSSWALTPMRWAVANGIISAKSNNKLAPNGTASRAECAQIIYKYSGNFSNYTIKSSNGAKVRNSASSSGTQIGALAKGSVVTYDQSVSADGYTWYHIISVNAKNGSWGNYSGWVANV